MSGVAKVPSPPVALSTSFVYPERTPDAFEIAARLGYDGIEVMVYTDPVSQDADVLRRLRDYHQLPIVSVHAPSLLLTQRVWGREPWEKLRRAKDLAERVGARVVVLHPPFRWQRDYVRGFEQGLAAMAEETDVKLRGGEHVPAAGRRPRGRALRPALGPDRARRAEHHPGPVAHRRVRLRRPDHGDRARQPPGPRAPGRRHRLAGPVPDEHLVPGHGGQPCGELLGLLPSSGSTGAVVVEVKTNRAPTREERVADLAESLAFARKHLAPPGQA